VSATGRVLVPVCGADADHDALELACLIAKRGRRVVEAVFVIEVERSLPLDAEMQAEIERGETVLDHAERTAQSFDVEMETSLLQARDAGAAIVDEAVQTNAETIVMGLPYKMKFGEYSLGKTASYVLKNAPCRVWLARQPIPS
jgi:nucleotide-binding universal stress UspA family protein